MKKYYIILLGFICFSQIVFASINQAARSDNQASINAAVDKALPVSPEQVKAAVQKEQAIDQAQQMPPINKNQLAGTIRSINLSDNAPPPLLHLVKGYTTNISFIGENGSPWPIESVVSGGNAVSINQSVKDNAYNSSLTVNQSWGSTNVSYYLKGRVRPITLYIYTADNPNNGLDGDITVKIDGLPPGSAPLPVKNITAVSDELLNSLNHAPGNNWDEVKLDDTNIPVGIHYWISPDHKRAIVRISSGTLVLPEWGSQASSPDNTTTAYEFNHIPLMLWVDSDDGQSFRLRVNDATSLIAGSAPIMKVRNVTPDIPNKLRGMHYAK